MAKLFFQAGCNVAITSTKQKKIDTFLWGLPAGCGRMFPFMCDIRQKAHVEDLVLQLKEQVGPIDILINNVN